jgi:hypothetical protein
MLGHGTKMIGLRCALRAAQNARRRGRNDRTGSGASLRAKGRAPFDLVAKFDWPSRATFLCLHGFRSQQDVIDVPPAWKPASGLSIRARVP